MPTQNRVKIDTFELDIISDIDNFWLSLKHCRNINLCHIVRRANKSRVRSDKHISCKYKVCFFEYREPLRSGAIPKNPRHKTRSRSRPIWPIKRSLRQKGRYEFSSYKVHFLEFYSLLAWQKKHQFFDQEAVFQRDRSN